MKKFLFPLLLCFGFAAVSYAREFSVSGAVVDSVGEAESFATWRVFALPDTVRPVAGNVTGDDGCFYSTLPHAGDYRISVVGMNTLPAEREFSVSDDEPQAALGNIILAPASTELSEITVTAMRPLVVKEIDRLSYDVLADEESKTAPLADILRKVPMVTVDPDGTIKVNGSTNFRIYKNGRPNNSFTNNAKEIFKAIPASTIRKIEVITDPGAREDAEGVGAILNIVTNNQTSLQGVLGSVSVYGNSNNITPTPNLWMTTQYDKLTVALNGGYYNMNNRESSNDDSLTGTYTSTGNTLETYNKYKSNHNAGYGGLEASFELDTMNLFTAEVNGFFRASNFIVSGTSTLSDPAGDMIYNFDTHSDYPVNRYFDIDAAVNYQHSTHRAGETFTVSYRISSTNQKQEQTTQYDNMINAPMNYTGIDSDFDLNFIEHTGQFDWARKFGQKHSLDTGLKFIQRNNHSKNRRDYVGAGDTYDEFSHRTSIGAVFADYRVNLGKVNMRAGLRYEYSHLAAKFLTGDKREFSSNLNDFAPNVAVNWQVDDANTLKISYNRRISRPGISYLDPTVSETPLTTSSGNPNLKSTNFDRISLNYSIIKSKINLDFSADYSMSNGMLSQVKWVENEHTYYTYDNTDHYRNAGFSLYAQWSPFDKTTFTVNGRGAWNRVHSPVQQFTKCGWDGSVYLQLTQKLPWKLTLRGYGFWWSGDNSLYSYSRNNLKYFEYGISFSRTFLKEDRMSVNLSVHNPFGPYTKHYRTYGINSDFLSRSVSTMHNKFDIGFNISYRFGSLQASVKKTAASINNDDLQGGKK